MLLTITTTHHPATDLSYLLHKHPSRVQKVDLSTGDAHIFYTEIHEECCTAALLLDIDPIALVRRDSSGQGNDFALEQYVNDRPYVASSFMSAAIAKAFSSALNGRCNDRPELVGVSMPFEVVISVLPVRGGEEMLRQLFEPLGYTVEYQQHMTDAAFPQWGQSRYFTVKLTHNIQLQHLLSHLYVLIPVCDNDKHYWVGKHEVEKLIEKGSSWLPSHPLRELIATRYLKHQKSLTQDALAILLKDEMTEDEDDAQQQSAPEKVRIHDLRLQRVKDEILKSGASRVADLGCGEGRLIKLLLAEKQIELVLGMDVSIRALEIAAGRLRTARFNEQQKARLQLLQGSLTYRDQRLEGFDAAALVEVIEHLDEPRLAALQRTVFQFARPQHVFITTPNAEYNIRFPDFEEGLMRHGDHRFEWTRQQFQSWAATTAEHHNYSVRFGSIGEEDPEVGALTQIAIFKRNS